VQKEDMIFGKLMKMGQLRSKENVTVVLSSSVFADIRTVRFAGAFRAGETAYPTFNWGRARYDEFGMHISPLPVPLQQLGGRRFSFYPPIRNLDHNEWLYRRATWSEVVVVNTNTGEEVCLPRAVIGDVSITDHPIVIVGLKRELEWKEGAICTHRRPVIELPVAVNQSGFVAPPHPERLAPVVSIRLESHRKLYTGRKIGVGLMLGAARRCVAAEPVVPAAEPGGRLRQRDSQTG